jgi:hypothetical protein
MTGVKNVLINKDDEIFVQFDGGIAISKDEGNTWTLCNEGLSFKTSFTAFATSDNGYAYSGFSRDRLYRRNIFNTTSVKELSSLPESFAYPNPASEKVSFSLPEGFADQDINIEVYNISGILKLSFSHARASNDNKIQLDLGNFENGVYYAVIKSGSISRVEKFSIIK